jgi:hypothetical protein
VSNFGSLCQVLVRIAASVKVELSELVRKWRDNSVYEAFENPMLRQSDPCRFLNSHMTMPMPANRMRICVISV